MNTDRCVYCGNVAQCNHHQHRACFYCWQRIEDRCFVHLTPLQYDDNDGKPFCLACYINEYRATSGQAPEGYLIVATNAPTAYDGFGTVTLKAIDGEPQRLVAIRTEHREWQFSRYASGLYYYFGVA